MGPLLFIIFVDTKDDGVANGVLEFANGIKIFRVINDARDQDAFQFDLDKLVQ